MHSRCYIYAVYLGMYKRNMLDTLRHTMQYAMPCQRAVSTIS